jgi:natural product precursor
MKKPKFEGKLSLKKETVARLNDAQMNEVKGGSVIANTVKCYVIIKDIRPVPPCTISFNTPISIKDVNVVYH